MFATYSFINSTSEIELIILEKYHLRKFFTGQISRQNAPLCEAEEAEEEEEVSTTLLEVEEPELAGGACWC